jgi:hypothetical protein
MKFKMAATAGLSLTLDPMGKMFQNAFPLKPLGQLKPNCPGMIIGRSSTNFLFFNFQILKMPFFLIICLLLVIFFDGMNASVLMKVNVLIW